MRFSTAALATRGTGADPTARCNSTERACLTACMIPRLLEGFPMSLAPLTCQEPFATLAAHAEASKDQTGGSPHGQTGPSARRQTRSQRVQPKEGKSALPARRAGIRQDQNPVEQPSAERPDN